MAALEAATSSTFPVTSDVHGVRAAIVNVYFVGAPDGDGWVLVDAGLHGSAGRIVRSAERVYGPGTRPRAIVLTHGHFDHVGALGSLLEHWGDVPLFAHELELPYLTGRSAYPPPDPTVGGGAMAEMSRLYPSGPSDFTGRVQMLPADGAVPGAPGWRWFETPGHSPGHVSLFRSRDRVLIAGDAVVTTKQESMLAAITQRPEMHGPPRYFTADWQRARDSVNRIALLEPEVLATGHGRPMRGSPMRADLQRLAADFEELAVPARGRYVPQPAITDETGVVHVPPPVPDHLPKVLMSAGAAVMVGLAARQLLKTPERTA